MSERLYVSSEHYFGACPICAESDGHLNIGRCHWGLCERHRVKWPIGENLFGDWKRERHHLWLRNKEKLADYREVKPIYSIPATPSDLPSSVFGAINTILGCLKDARRHFNNELHASAADPAELDSAMGTLKKWMNDEKEHHA